MPSSPNENRDRLAHRLRALRAAAGFSGNGFAAHIEGWSQSKVSKLETARQLPSDDDLRTWARHTEPDALDELRALLAAARVEYADWRSVSRSDGGLAAHQAYVAQVEAATTRIGEFQPSLVPALAQTAEYAAALLNLPPGPVGAAPLTAEDVDRIVGFRMRRQEVLYQARRTVHIVFGEAALWACPGDVEVQRGQLGKLEVVASLPAVELGVVPIRRMPVLPMSGFRIYDETSVVLESLSGEQTLRDADDVRGYVGAFDLLRAESATGEAAVRRVRDALAQLEDEGSS